MFTVPARSPGPTTRQDILWVVGPGERAGAATQIL